MSILHFCKYQGQGNHFVFIDDLSLNFPTYNSDLIKNICHSCYGVGADGLILLQPSEKFDYKMRIFNLDGLEAQSCGNGIFCLAQYLVDKGISKEQFSFELVDSSAVIRKRDEKWLLNLGAFKNLSLDQSLNIDKKVFQIHQINTGVPHVVFFTDPDKNYSFIQLAKKMRFHPQFAPQGTNVNFVSWQDKRKVFVRTYERGVEKETFACGTGACAVATICALHYHIRDFLTLLFKGGDYKIFFSWEKKDLKSVEMLGSSSKVFQGTLEIK